MKIKEFYTDKSRWTQHTFYNMYGACCLMGALQKCYPVGNPDSVAKRLEVESKLRAGIVARTNNRTAYVYFVSSLTRWNDAPERTFEEVKALVEELDV